MINPEIFPVKPLEVDSNVGYFFLWKPSLKSVMFTLLCRALRLPDTFRCVSRTSNVGYFFLWTPNLKSVMFTLLFIALRLPDTFRCVSRASNVGYFFLVEAQSEVRYVHTTLYSVKVIRYLHGCLLCSWKSWQNLVFSAFTFERLKEVKLVENKSLWDLSLEGRFGLAH